MKKIITSIFLICLTSFILFGQKKITPPTTRVLFILDASNSMTNLWNGVSKFDRSTQLLSELLDSLSASEQFQYMEFGLRLYGHQSPVPPQDCEDTKLEVKFSKNNVDEIKNTLNSVTPQGTTPIAYSLLQAADDFPEDKFARNIIILITDGIERCDGDPCAISMALQKKGTVLKPYVLGIDLDVDIADILDCVGNYYDISTKSEFKKALSLVVNQVNSMTTVQVNLLDTNNKPTETNAVMSFHDNLSSSIRYTYMHTLNSENKPDTLYLDVLSTYNLKVHTIPPVYLDTIILKEDIHNIIELPAPQGILEIDIKGNNTKDNSIKTIVRKTGELETLHILDANKKQKYLTGRYDIEILTMPRIYKYGVEIKQNNTQTIVIEEPGEVVINFIKNSFGTLLHENGDILTNIYDFRPEKNNYTLRLQPGYYRIVYRESKSKKTINTSEAAFRVKSGKINVLNL